MSDTDAMITGTTMGDAVRTVLQLWVPGDAVPQGSMSPYTRGGKMAVKAANEKRLKPWRARITRIVGEAWNDRRPLNEPVIVHLSFYFRRPATQHGSGRNAAVLKRWALTHPTNRSNGDVDKLARALLDGIDQAGVFADDARVRRLTVEKEWAQASEQTGVMIAVSIDETPQCLYCRVSEAEWRHLRSGVDPRSCCPQSSHDGATMTMATDGSK